jgi:hypothetical protein
LRLVGAVELLDQPVRIELLKSLIERHLALSRFLDDGKHIGGAPCTTPHTSWYRRPQAESIQRWRNRAF